MSDTSIRVRTPSATLLPDILERMNSFNTNLRREALMDAMLALRHGKVVLPPTGETANVHAHTFHSFSTFDYSPSRLVWEAANKGLAVIGSTDFDVLNAMDEMYDAGDAIGIRATVSLETRAFVRSYADREINSPGEPGVIYVMGAGFTDFPAEDSLYPSLAERSHQRNLVMISKVNAALSPVEIDFDRDVRPLTPSGNATERHLCAAYDAKARALYSDPAALAAFWAQALGVPDGKAAALIGADDMGGALRNAIRAKLMKRGGVGYTQPDAGSFPGVEEFFAMVRDTGAIPCLAWLDGTSEGEKDPARLLDDAMAWGARCVNIIPERNWNIADPEQKKLKLAALEAFVAEARKRELPILAGTEMNGPGQKFVDSFDAPELQPYVKDFMDGAYWLYGHTVLQRMARTGAMSAWVGDFYGRDRASSNAFFVKLGRSLTLFRKI